jgi:hypothetical protein
MRDRLGQNYRRLLRRVAKPSPGRATSPLAARG